MCAKMKYENYTEINTLMLHDGVLVNYYCHFKFSSNNAHNQTHLKNLNNKPPYQISTFYE